MSTTSKTAHHEHLMERMATRNGADFDLARQSGLIDGNDIVEALVSCLGFSDAGDCATRLDRETPGVPDYCRNATLIARVEEFTH